MCRYCYTSSFKENDFTWFFSSFGAGRLGFLLGPKALGGMLGGALMLRNDGINDVKCRRTWDNARSLKKEIMEEKVQMFTKLLLLAIL